MTYFKNLEQPGSYFASATTPANTLAAPQDDGLPDVIGPAKQQQAQQVEAKPLDRSVDEMFGDMGLSLLQGGVGIGQAVVGLGDMFSGGHLGKLVEDHVVDLEHSRNYWQNMKSDYQKQAEQNVSNAKGVWNTVKAVAANPTTIASGVAESLPLMLAGGFAGRLIGGAAKLAGVSLGAEGVITGALGEGIVGAGASAEQVRGENADGYMSGKQSLLSGVSGAGTALFGFLGGKVARKLGITDFDVMAAGGDVGAAAAKKGITRQTIEGAFSEGFLEELPQSIQEQVLQNIALEKEDIWEGVDQASVMGAVSGMAMGGGINTAQSIKAKMTRVVETGGDEGIDKLTDDEVEVTKQELSRRERNLRAVFEKGMANKQQIRNLERIQKARAKLDARKAPLNEGQAAEQPNAPKQDEVPAQKKTTQPSVAKELQDEARKINLPGRSRAARRRIRGNINTTILQLTDKGIEADTIRSALSSSSPVSALHGLLFQSSSDDSAAAIAPAAIEEMPEVAGPAVAEQTQAPATSTVNIGDAIEYDGMTFTVEAGDNGIPALVDQDSGAMEEFGSHEAFTQATGLTLANHVVDANTKVEAQAVAAPQQVAGVSLAGQAAAPVQPALSDNIPPTSAEGEAAPVASPHGKRSAKQLANDKKLSQARNTVNQEKDDILKAISKTGGLDYTQVHSEWGKTISDQTKDLNRKGVFGKPVVRKKGGMPLDRMVENLKEHGYLPQDADINSLLEAVSKAAHGDQVTAINNENQIEAELDAAEQEYYAKQEKTPEEIEAEIFDISDEQLAEVGYNDMNDAERLAYEALVDRMNDEGFIERLAIQYQGVSDEQFYREAAREIEAELGRRAALQQSTESQPAESSQSPSKNGADQAQQVGFAESNVTAKPGEDLKLFATPSTFGKKPLSANAEHVNKLDFSLEEEEAGLFSAPEDSGSSPGVVQEQSGTATESKPNQEDAESEVADNAGAVSELSKEPTEKQEVAKTSSKKKTSELNNNSDKKSSDSDKKSYGSTNKIFTKDKADAALAKLMNTGKLSSNPLLDPELAQAGIMLAGYHIEAGARKFSGYVVAMKNSLGEQFEKFKPYLKGWYFNVKADPAAAEWTLDGYDDVDKSDVDYIVFKEGQNKETTDGTDERNSDDLERDSEDTGASNALGQESVSDEPGADGRASEQGISGTEGQKDPASSGVGLSGSKAAPAGKRGDQSPYSTNGAIPLEDSATGSNDGERGDNDSFVGSRIEPVSTAAVKETATVRSSLDQKRAQQKKAQSVKVVLGDRANIDESLPFLHEGQKDDVAFAEQRFLKPNGYGTLFTNGTGTGKTYTGLGVAKRFERQGKDNILILAPDEKVLNDWIDSGRNLQLNIKQLQNTKDNGSKGIVITTYANAGMNDELAKREWDLVLTDESHNLMQAKDGKATRALASLRAITNHPGGKYNRFDMLFREQVEKRKELFDQSESAKKLSRLSDTTDQQRVSLNKKAEALDEKIKLLDKRLETSRKEVYERVDSAQGKTRTRVLMLSATPFAYEKNIDYAEGYLFDYPEEGWIGNSKQGGYEKFMVEHFGYRIRYHKLTEPEASVNRGLMQRQFNSWMKKEETLSGRMLDVDKDYDRKFVLTESAIGTKIDEGMEFLWDNEHYRPLWDVMRKKFDYLSRRYLLEAIKAREVVPLIKEHMALGRKVVVFHDYKKGGGYNPFDMSSQRQNGSPANLQDPDGATIGQLAQEFEAERPDLVNLDLRGLLSAVGTFNSSFGSNDLLVVNGDQKKADNLAAYKRFNDDENGPQVMLVQSAKNAGWSGHDTTGKYPRVLFNLGLPERPTMAIQQEGRIYRVGQASNAMFRYLNTGTNWERMSFAETIAQRSSTAENLALGEEARALMDSFITAFEESDRYPAGHENEGTGGKEIDAAANAVLTEWDRATSFYYSQAKKNSRTKAMEGKDYFATPEPLGLKMMEWADIRGGDHVLEPSAGHGAIARWMPENAIGTVIEPSSELASRLKMVTPAKLIQGSFEDHHVVNKYDAIVMNPPFGSGGKTAIDHLKKATDHLRDGGRVVALIPTGPAADKKFDKWFYGEDEKGKAIAPNLYLRSVRTMPQVTFERAGTKVATRVVVIDKIMDKDAAAELQPQSNRDYTNAENVNEFFDRIEESSAEPRVVKEKEESAPDTPRQQRNEEKAEAQQKGESLAQESGAAIVEHTTKKGKVLRGVIRTDLTKEQAKEIDKFTWKKDGGFFVRIEHLEALNEKYPINAGDTSFSLKPNKKADTSSKEFKAWFGDSKVVDGSGEPLTVYHGSPDARFMQDDGIFKSQKEQFGMGEGGGAHWFASSQRTAATYADDSRAFDYQMAEPEVIPAYLMMENPLVVDGKGRKWRDAQKRGKTSDVISEAREGGHDGVIIKNVRDDYTNDRSTPTDTYVVFESTQIKSIYNTGTFDSRNPDVRYSQDGVQRTATPNAAELKAKADHLNDIFGPIVSKWKNAPDFEIIATQDDLPASISKKIGKGQIRGAYVGGKVILVAENLNDTQEGAEVLLHEAIGHYGMRQVFGGDFTLAMNQLYNRIGKADGLAKLGEEFGIDLDGYRAIIDNPKISIEKRNEIIMDEFLAHLAEQGREPGIVKRIVAAIRKGLRRLGLELAISDNDLIALIADAKRQVIKGKGSVAVTGSRFRMVPKIFSPQFKSWFKDSKIVKEDGYPQVVYHGTNADFNVFNESDRGIFFTASQEVASNYTEHKRSVNSVNDGNVLPVYLSMQDPIYLKFGSGTSIAAAVKQAQAQGKDGVIVKGYPDTYGGFDTVADMYIVFAPNQIKSAVGNSGDFGKETDDIRYSRKGDIPATISVDGTERPTTNSEGKLIHATRQGIYSFWRWYDSHGRRVDSATTEDKDNGRDNGSSDDASRDGRGRGRAVEQEPVVYYHGTSDDFSTFDINHPNRKDSGWLGDGIYMTSAKQIANIYAKTKRGASGQNIMPVYAAVHNPYPAPKGFKKALSRASKEQILGVTNQIKALGHDGVRMDYIDGAVELVAFEPNQVKSATGNNGNFATDDNDIRYSLAYHGSPHRFDKFSTNNIGTGEGAQAYGWGLYFAEKKEVAEWYKEQLADTANLELDPDEMAGYFFDELAKDGPVVAGENETAYSKEQFVDAWLEEDFGPLDFPEKIRDAVESKFSGSLYQVELAPSEDEYLLWDKPLSEQSDKVKDSLLKILPTRAEALESIKKEDRLADELLGEDDAYGPKHKAWLRHYNSQKHQLSLLSNGGENNNGADIYDKLFNAMNDQKLASEYLHSLGIRGIKYFDGTSRSNGAGAYNYVVFSDDDVEINERYSLRGNGKGKNKPSLASLQNKKLASYLKTAKPQVKTAIDYLRMKFQDKFVPLLNVQKTLETQGWVKTEKNDAYRAEELYHGKTTKRLEDFYDQKVKPLIDKIQKSSVSLDEVESYLYALYAPQRNAHIAAINPKFPDGGSGMTNAEAQKIRDDFDLSGKTGELEKLAATVREITTMQREIIRKEGLELDDTVEAWEVGNDLYVPLKGGKDEQQGRGIGTGFNVRRSGTKQALGRKSKAENILAELFSQVGATIVRAEKAKVGRAFLNMVEENPNDNWRVYDPKHPETMPKKRKMTDNPEMKRVKKKLDRRKYALGRAQGKAKAKLQAEVLSLQLELNSMRDKVVRDVLDLNGVNNDNVMAVTKEDGSVVYVEMEDTDLARVMQNLTPNQQGSVTRTLALATRYLSRMSTSLNPEFFITNFERDLQTALIHLGGEKSATFAKDTLKSVPGAIKGIRNYLRKGDKNSEWGKWFERFRNAGAEVSFMDLQGVEEWQAKLNKVSDKDGFLKNAKATGTAIKDMINDYNSVFENAMRLAAFRNGIKNGMSDSDAASFAKNLTVNFNRKGEVGPAMNALYMFANAGVQGSARIIQAMVTSKRVRKIAAGIVVSAVGLAELGRYMGGDDDDDESKWDKLSDYTKQTNLIFMSPEGKAFKIKMPYGYNVFVALGYAISDIFHGRDVSEVAGFVGSSFMNAFNPLGGDEGLLKVLSPTLVDPLVEIATNENFAGAKIAPENFPFGPEKPDSQLYFRSVSSMSKATTEWLNSLTGGSKWESGAADISPESIDHLVSFALGGLGRTVGRVIDLPGKAVQGQLEVKDIPFLRQVVETPNGYVDIERFYGNMEDIEKYRANLKEMPASDRAAFVRSHPTTRLYKLSSATSQRLSKIRKAYYAAMDSGDSAKANRLQEQMQKTAKLFNKKVNALK
jgi:hypothetical protein